MHALDEVRTVLLRFRDLVTNNDETITRHKEIIEKYGYVWWAWWKKGNETLPKTIFPYLDSVFKNNATDLLLVDSGQSKVYKATCNKIEFDISKCSPSPDKSKTPEYYSKNEYAAWFRFTSINECAAEEVRNYTYLDYDELFQPDTANYGKFDGKRIYDVKELIQQNRTVWFVREFSAANDQDYSIILLDADIVEPHQFSPKYYETKSNSLLWLSDLHFPDSQFPEKKGTTTSTIVEHMKTCLPEISDIGGLIITGDITSRAKVQGFDKALSFINELNYELKNKLKSESIIFCPGNHDLKRIETDLSGEPGKVTDDSKSCFNGFFEKIHNIKPNEYLASGRKMLLKSGRALEIASLNSNYLQQYRNYEGHGFISQEQLDFVSEKMEWEKSKDNYSTRIVIMHHHYLPTCYKDTIDVNHASSVVYDAERLMQWLLENNVKLLLHGHKHLPFYSKVSRPVTEAQNVSVDDKLEYLSVFGMGGMLEAGIGCVFSTLNFDGNNLEVKLYRIYPDQSVRDAYIKTITIPL